MGIFKKLKRKKGFISSAIKVAKTIKNRPISSEKKGIIGEEKVSSKLNPRIFGKVEHRELDNVVIIDDYGKSHQIDHIEIRENGIFCIETKNYAGYIFGNEWQDQWVQMLRGEKYKFFNPVKQNKAHIYHLNKVLGGKFKINSVIVMVNDNADKIDIPYVVNLKDLSRYLSEYNDGIRYSLVEIDKIYKTIKSIDRRDVTNKEHIKSIQNTQKAIEKNMCPHCGGKLELKEGRYGKFYGCINYPNCKYTKKAK